MNVFQRFRNSLVGKAIRPGVPIVSPRVGNHGRSILKRDIEKRHGLVGKGAFG
jgi:hypothetical protein